MQDNTLTTLDHFLTSLNLTTASLVEYADLPTPSPKELTTALNIPAAYPSTLEGFKPQTPQGSKLLLFKALCQLYNPKSKIFLLFKGKLQKFKELSCAL